MTLRNQFTGPDATISFELFPPKTEAGDAALFRHVERLLEFDPSFFTCTYGAGGSTRDKTLGIVSRVKSQLNIPVASHLTCVGSTVDQLRSFLSAASEHAIDYIVALRGDPPQGESKFQAVEGGLQHASDLVSLIRSEFPSFGIAVAGYPEKHQEAPSLEVDLKHLQHKVDCGADVVITQLFYRNEDFFAFRDHCENLGIDVPLVPGILPVTNLVQIQRITSLCGAALPEEFVNKLQEKDDPAWQFDVGVEFAAQQVQDLIDGGVPGVHFYVLNKSEATSEVLSRIRISS